MAHLAGLRLWLALALALAASAKAQSPIPACPDLSIQARLLKSKGSVASGDKVLLTVDVLNTGTAALDGINVGLTSSLVADWRSPLKAKVPALVSGYSVYWPDQYLRSSRRESYQVKARVCSDVGLGRQSLASAMVYRLNATGGIVCMTTVDSNTVSQSNRSDQVIECWQRAQATLIWTLLSLTLTTVHSRR